MRVIGSGNLVRDAIFLHQLLEDPVAEMLSTITNNCSRSTKTGKYSVF